MLIGESGAITFEKTGIITGEDVQFSNKATSNPVEGGGVITDHAVADPVKVSISGVVNSEDEYKALEAMAQTQELLSYRGDEAFDDLLILNLQRTRAPNNSTGYGFKISFQRMTITTTAFVDIEAPTMSQQDAGAPRSGQTQRTTRQATQNGTTTTNSAYTAYVAGFNGSTNSSVGSGRSNPGYAGC